MAKAMSKAADASKSDYLALTYFNGVGSWWRCPNAEEAIERCARLTYTDWHGHYDLKGNVMPVNLFDVRGHDTVVFDGPNVIANGKRLPVLRIEEIKLPLPKKKAGG